MQESDGSVYVAPGVIAAIAGLTALSVDGVARLSHRSSTHRWRLVGHNGAASGVKIRSDGEAIVVDLNLVLRRDSSMLRVARDVQGQVAEAIRQLVGVDVREVNVFVRGAD